MNKTKDYLNQIKNIEARIEAKEEEKKRLMSTLPGCKAQQYDHIGSVNAVRQNHVAELNAKIADVEREIIEEIDRLVDLKQKISTEIDSLDDNTYSTLLNLKYIQNKTDAEIAGVLYCSERHVRRLHQQALSCFEKRVLLCPGGMC